MKLTTATLPMLLLSALSSNAAEVTLNYDQFTLENGLRVVIHEDRKAPIVAVSVWYHVGSKDEPEGKTGFAHLFEHLMFNGSENYAGEWFEPLNEVGATDVNGNTWFDRTSYFQTVPTPALERALWMESDRMGHLLGAVTQEKLDEQRSVVQNEKRQGDDQPYGRAVYAVLDGLLPEGHPYSHSTIGSMADLNAASLDDVKQWFETYYGAANAVLVLAGDIDVATAQPMVMKYFGDIEAGPPLIRSKANAPKLNADKRDVMFDQVPQARFERNWVAPGRVNRDAAFLTLAAEILGGGKTSRLHKRLVHDLEIATSASANNQNQELLNIFSITIDAREDADLEQVTVEMERVIERFLDRGPTTAELSRAKTSIEASLIRRLEKVGDFDGKAAQLAEGLLYAIDPGFVIKWLDWVKTAAPADVLAASRSVMNAGYYQLDILPYPQYTGSSSSLDRSLGLPQVPLSPDLSFPDVDETILDNGLRVVVANRSAVPIVEFSIQFDAGYAADSATGGMLGLASFTAAMLDEGAGRRSSTEIAEELVSLGATLEVSSNLDTTAVNLSTLRTTLTSSLDLLADVIRNPSFSDAEINRLRNRWTANIEQEMATPDRLALRLLGPEVYGDDHAYGIPLTGSGTIGSINSITRGDLTGFHSAWMRPDNGTVFIVGDTSMAEVLPLLERSFGNWRVPDAAIPQKKIGTVRRPAKGKVIIVDNPGSSQSLLLAAHVALPTGTDSNIAIDAMNDILGGQFSSRVNMNLREDKGWAYGAYTYFINARGQRLYLVYAPVQTDKTAESIAELLRELKSYKTTEPATQAELKSAIESNTRSLPGAFETSTNVLSSLMSSARFGRPWNYPATLKHQYSALSLSDISAAVDTTVNPDSLIWVVVGDRQKIEAGIRQLDIGAIEVVSMGVQ